LYCIVSKKKHTERRLSNIYSEGANQSTKTYSKRLSTSNRYNTNQMRRIHSILFFSILFHSILFYCISKFPSKKVTLSSILALFYGYSMFYSILFSSILYLSQIDTIHIKRDVSILFYSIIFHSILLYCILKFQSKSHFTLFYGYSMFYSSLLFFILFK